MIRVLLGSMALLAIVSALPAALRVPAGGTAMASFAQPAAAAQLFPFVLPWDDASESVANVGAWLHKPAGRRGFVTVRGGHLAAGDRRLRLFGVNVCFGACFPTHADAEKIAARMAKFGINAVRFHHMDMFAAPGGIFRALPEGDPNRMRALDPGQLDRLDYFIAQLKRHGIYTDLNLHVSRSYPGLPTWEGMPSFHKGIDLFFPRALELQKEYARDLLTHRNPHTNTRYVDEPAVVLLEINNEDGLLWEWWTGALDGMPALFADELSGQWNRWLQARYPAPGALERAWGVTAEPLGDQLLANGDFRTGPQSWNLEQHEGAQAAWEVTRDAPGSQPSLRIQVSRPGKEAWHVQAAQSGLRLQPGKAYTLAFQAKADAPRRIAVNAMQAHAPWRQFWSSDAALTAQWQPLTFTFQVPEGDDNARITFSSLGGAPGTFWFAGASLRPGGVLGLQPGERPGSLPLFRKRDFARRTTEAQRDWIRFLWETEERYWTGMSRFLKEELKAKALVLGSQVAFSPVPIQAQLDVVDNHAYWQHPAFPGRPWDPENWSVRNLSLTKAGAQNPLTHLALQRPFGKPYLVTEYNHSAPNTYGSETFPLVAAMAALQDWDGVFLFAYSHRRDDWNPRRITSFFDVDTHPTKMATLPAAAALFTRGDLAPFHDGAAATVTRDQLLDRSRVAGASLSAASFGVPPADALRRQVGFHLAPKPPALPIPRQAPGQLAWDAERGVVTVESPRSKALVGFATGAVHDLGGVRVSPAPNRQNWVALTLTALTGPDFRSPGRILLTATGYAQNTGMVWKDPQQTSVGRSWGQAPSLVEGIPATLTFPLPAARLRAWPLDERGQRKAELPLRDTDGRAILTLAPQHRTLWYEVEIR